MLTTNDGASRRPLPRGLRLCETCGEVRGICADGRVSACFCSGLVCNRCGARVRRPITDFYDAEAGHWSHIPYFHQMGHRCSLAPGESPKGAGWTYLTPAPEVLAYQEALTRWTLELMGPDTQLEIVDGDQLVGTIKLQRPS